MSWQAHRELFDAYDGINEKFTTMPTESFVG